MSENLTIIEHPVLLDKLGELRNQNTTSHSFRGIMSELSALMAYEATRDLKTSGQVIETPLEKAEVPKVSEDIITVSIFRAGLAMQEGVLRTVPFSKVGHIGIYRDKFINNTVEYYFKLPNNCDGMKVLLCDPLLATGDTMIAACNRLKEYNVGEIRILSLLVSNKAMERMAEEHPDVKVYAIGVERELTDKGYLKPGIGDVGDRLYSTL